MARHLLIALSRPIEGREAEYNDWYQNVHLAQMVALPGFVSAQRFRFSAALGARDNFPYLAIYEIDTDDIGESVRAIESSPESGTLFIADSIDRQAAYAAIYEEFGDVVRR